MGNTATIQPPVDLTEAIQQIAARDDVISARDDAISARDDAIDVLKRDLNLMRKRVEDLLRHRHGPKTERVDSGQLSLFGDSVLTQVPAAPPKTKRKKKSAHKGRQALPAGLERRVETLVPDEAGGSCQCCIPPKPLKLIGCDRTETLAYKPAELFVEVRESQKWACPSGSGTVFAPEVTPRVLPKSLIADSLLAYLLISKFVDHMPLHRLRKQFRRDGVEIADSTMCGWIGGAADALSPILVAMKQQMMARSYVQADETPAKARDPMTKGKLKQIYFWVYSVPWEEVIFDYQKSREGKHATNFLRDFEGEVVQVDEYSGYDALFRLRPELTRAGCWVHARRYFKKALDRGDRPSESLEIIKALRWLFRLETQMRQRGYSPACRLRVRHRIHKPVLGVLLEHCTGVVNAPEIELQSDYGKAARYVVNHFDSLSVFLENGEIEMDNNGIENSIRPLAIGRKNWLHVGHIEAGDRAAVLYSIFATCERLGVNPRDYLLHVFSKLPMQDPNRMHELTPRAWRDSQATHPG